MITIICEGLEITGCQTVVMVPEIAVREPGYIQAFTTSAESGAKHEFHALAQMAYFQYDDGELPVDDLQGGCTVSFGEKKETFDQGAVIYRKEDGEIRAAVHPEVNRKKLFEAANRYCTRWIRLDI